MNINKQTAAAVSTTTITMTRQQIIKPNQFDRPACICNFTYFNNCEHEYFPFVCVSVFDFNYISWRRHTQSLFAIIIQFLSFARFQQWFNNSIEY